MQYTNHFLKVGVDILGNYYFLESTVMCDLDLAHYEKTERTKAPLDSCLELAVLIKMSTKNTRWKSVVLESSVKPSRVVDSPGLV